MARRLAKSWIELFGALTLLTLTLAGCDGRPKESATAKPAAEVRLQLLDFNGIQQLIAGHRGKVIVVDCWSTSCEPCKQAFPNLVALHKQFSADRVACVSLSFDYEGIGRPEDVQPAVIEFLRKQGATFDNVLSRLEADELYPRLGVTSVPTVLVYDPTGNLVAMFNQEPIYAEVQPLVERLLAQH